MKSKIRVTLLSPEGVIISDRLVDQATEFYQGPKEVHKGPLRLELNLMEEADIEKAQLYLNQLVGKVPKTTIAPKTKANTGSKVIMSKEEDSLETREAYIEEIYSKSKDQDDFIKKLRGEGFRFLHSEMLEDIKPKGYKIKAIHLKKYQWLVRLTREAKDPKNDRYDLTTIIGISILDKRTPRILLYLFGEYHKTYKLEVPKKDPIGQKNTNLIKYPHYMVHEERFKWGNEHRILLNNPDKKPTKFYVRWIKDVIVPDELKLTKPYDER